MKIQRSLLSVQKLPENSLQCGTLIKVVRVEEVDEPGGQKSVVAIVELESSCSPYWFLLDSIIMATKNQGFYRKVNSKDTIEIADYYRVIALDPLLVEPIKDITKYTA